MRTSTKRNMSLRRPRLAREFRKRNSLSLCRPLPHVAGNVRLQVAMRFRPASWKPAGSIRYGFGLAGHVMPLDERGVADFLVPLQCPERVRVGRYFLRGQRDRVLPARLFHGVKVSVTRVYADRHPPGAPGRPRPAEEASRVVSISRNMLSS